MNLGMTSASGSRSVPLGPWQQEWVWVALLIAATFALRLLLAISVGLSVDESYSTAVGQHFSLSYYDHPPAHLWLVGGVTRLLGSQAPWIARMPFMLLGIGSTVMLYLLTRRSFGIGAARWSILAFSAAPFFSVGSSGWVLPDGPLVFSALAAALSFRRALDDDRLENWLLCGLAVGFGLLSKYLMIVPVLGCLLFLIGQQPKRLLTVKPWCALMTALTVFSPVLIWNATHHWASFAFQGGRASFEGWHPSQAFALFVASVLYVGPWTAALSLRALNTVLRPPRDPEVLWFACLALPGIVVFSVLSLWAHVLPHWPMIAWLFAFPMVGHLLSEAEQAPVGRHRWQAWAKGSFGYLAFLLFFAISDVRFGLWDRWLPGFPLNDPLTELLDWKEIKPTVDRLETDHPGAVIVVQSFVDAGKVDYALGETLPVVCLCDDPHHYGIQYPVANYIGRDAIIVANARRKDWYERAQQRFDWVSTPIRLDIHRNRGVAVQIDVSVGHNLSITPREIAPKPVT